MRPETVDVRIVAATNRDLHVEMEAGRFRTDLFFRLSALTLKIPPLRERPHDIHLLADHFLRSYATRYGRETPRLSDQTMTMLSAYSFPGNVRELEGEMARLVAVGSEVLNDRIRGVAQTAPVAIAPMSLAEMEKKLILAVLESTGGNRTRAAEILGISREGLRTKMQRFSGKSLSADPADNTD